MAAELDQSAIKPGKQKPRRARPYDAPAGGWGSVKSLARALTRERVMASAPPALLRQNKPDGFACVSCALGQAGRPAYIRVLRERRQGDDMGNHLTPGR